MSNSSSNSSSSSSSSSKNNSSSNNNSSNNNSSSNNSSSNDNSSSSTNSSCSTNIKVSVLGFSVWFVGRIWGLGSRVFGVECLLRTLHLDPLAPQINCVSAAFGPLRGTSNIVGRGCN